MSLKSICYYLFLSFAVAAPLACTQPQQDRLAVPTSAPAANNLATNTHVETHTYAPYDGNDFGAPQAQSLIQVVLDTHNEYRRKHQAPDLKWNATLLPIIQAAINNCPNDDPTIPQGHEYYGENWYGQSSWGGSGVTNYTDLTQKGIQCWGDEGSNWNAASGQPINDNKGETGHYTQVVWKATTSVVCAWNLNKCQGNGDMQDQLVCAYYPPGNFKTGPTSYTDNVLLQA